jgi:hypothetical protein
MTTIATLGQANTFSELAARKYGDESGGEFSVEMPADAENDGGC